MRSIMQVALVAITIILVGLAGLGLVRMLDKDGQDGNARPVATTSPATGQTAGSTVAPVASVTGTDTAPEGGFRFHRLSVEAGGTVAEACLAFNAPLDGSGATSYADYVQVPDGVRPGFRVDGNRLCLSGLSFGTEYALTLRSGLPAAGGKGALAEDVPVTVGLADRPPAVAMGQGFILPRETGDGLPITTVNVDRLSIKLYRVGDRLLARMRQDFLDERTFYPYDSEQIAEDQGRLVWQGEMPVKGPRNEAVTSLFPLAKTIGTTEPGAYLLVASNPDAPRDDGEGRYFYSDSYRPAAGQWVVQSDLGLTSFAGDDGLTLSVRSLAGATPLAGTRLTLIARNNEVLGEVRTDEAGIGRFGAGLLRGEGGMAPVMVMAYRGDGDFNFLDLRRPGFDLSDRGVEGRPPAGPVDAFLYTERGIYRPGETVELTALLRDQTAHALTGRTFTLKLKRPDGKEHRRYDLGDGGGGAGHLSLVLPASAARGQWEATLHADPESDPVGRVAFQVQDFVPQRLALSVEGGPKWLLPGAPLSLDVTARFLYGAPGSDLTGEASMVIEPDPNPYPQHKGFRWGIGTEDFRADRYDLEIGTTDAEGRTQVTGTLPGDLQSTRPLRADISIAIREPGGRATSEHVYIPFMARDRAIGIRPHFDDSVQEGAQAGFDIIMVSEDGRPVTAQGLRWRLVRDTSTWQWFRSGGSWKYQRVPREREVASGSLDVAHDKVATIAQQVQWGGYRLIVTDPASGAATAVSFSGGWYSAAGADRPDRLKLAADRAGYAPGETARLHIESDVAGEALLVIANEKVQEVRTLTVAAGGTDLEVKLREEWGAGAYALVTLYRPLTAQLGHAPVRAVGVAWLGLDPSRRTLNVAIQAPERIAPRQTQEVVVTVPGAGRQAHVTLAAVDQGILQLTRFKTPEPQTHYLAKRLLGVAMRDDYGRLIRGLAQGDDQGGDSFGGKGLDVVPTRTVALFSGIVALDGDGTAHIPLEIPDFQGELRLMAVAWDKDRIGSADRTMVVRDPVVAELILPRFLSPDDQGRATVLLHNVEGQAGDYRLSVKASGAVAGGVEQRILTLATGERQVFTVPLDGRLAGIGTVGLSVTGPGGFQVDRSWPIQVRPPQLPVTREEVATLAPGQGVTLGGDLVAGMVPGTVSVSVSLSRWQGLDVPGMLRWLDRYPFGCLEQTVSRAMPLLWFNDLALMAGTRQDQAIADRVQDSIDRVLSMQQPDGGFSMWGGYGDGADPWISVFAYDFLMLAADQGYLVPGDALALGRRWLMEASTRAYPVPVQAYAGWVQARKGQANAGDLRYFHDSNIPEQALATAQLAAALDAIGERARAASAYDRARRQLAQWAAAEPAERAALETARRTGKPAKVPDRTDKYGSRLRDTYAIAALMANGGRGAAVPALLESAHLLDTRAEDTNTQEKAWMLRAAATLAGGQAKLAVAVDGRDVAGGDPVAVPVALTTLEQGLTLENKGETDLYRTLSVEGVPMAPEPASANGITLSKRLFTPAGEPVDPAQVRRNDRLVVVLEGNATEAALRGDYALLDLLPAGLEVEGVLRAGQAGYDWIGLLSDTQVAEGRDDRMVAALTLPAYRDDDTGLTGASGFALDRKWGFRVAYAVRAVTPGSFALPAAVAEHMYVPQAKARTEMGRMEIAE